MTNVSDRVAWRQLHRRSNACTPHRNKKKYYRKEKHRNAVYDNQ